jgi:Flp pilus assembly protein CpaB
MISRTTMMLGIFAALTAFIAAYGFRALMQKPEETTTPTKAEQEEEFKIPLAATNLPADRVVVGQDTYLSQPITRAQFEKRFPKVNMDEVIATLRSVVNRRLAKSIKQGQPFLTTDFYLMGTGPSVSAQLRPGFRAVAVQVPGSREAGVQPGMFVDVMFRASPRSAKNGQPAIPEKTVILMQHIEVLNAVRPDTKSQNTPAAAKPLLFTLAVPEDKVDVFGITSGRGEMWLVPTPANDKDKAKHDGAGVEVADASTLAELLGIKPKPPGPKPFETEFYERGRRKVNVFIDGKLALNHVNSMGRQALSDNESADEVKPTMPATRVAPTAPPAPEKD